MIGVELSELAIQHPFDELGAKPEIADAGPMRHYSAPNLDVFVGDFVVLTPYATRHLDDVYDRAALIALPTDMRTRYVAHVTRFTHRAPQLVICFEYDQTLMDGPAFSINEDELRPLYVAHCGLTLWDFGPSAGGPGWVAAPEIAWRLR